ncbi:MAG: YkuS family protein [Clostridiales bacterium]|nr:YkuS family protein [Clostridiales bacterium]
MIVAVTPELTRLAGQLRELGYDVVTYGAYRRPVDALVYSGQGLAAREVGANLTGANTGGSYGVLMVNASNKTVSQIDNSLKNRAYTPLF